MSGIKQSGKWVVLLSLVFMSLVITNPVQAAQEIYWVKAYPENAFINTPSMVKIMAQFAYDANLIRTGVNLIKVDQTGKQLAVLGVLYDDGTHGDDTAGDNIFTGQVSINEIQPAYLYYRVSAAYKGTLKRLISDTVTVPVKTTVGPEKVKSQVISALAQGDIAVAKNNFVPGKSADALDGLTSEKQALLRMWLENSTLTKDMPNMRVYETHWVDDGGTDHLIKFLMIPNGLGEWKIIW